MADELWRLFIGLRLPAAHGALLEQIQRELAAAKLAVRWISPANFHLTLHFLGDIDPAAVPTLQAALAAGLAHSVAPMLDLAELGAFPSLGQPHVIWAGLRPGGPQAAEHLLALHEQAVAAGAAVGVAREERPFHPHLTLGYLHKQARQTERRTAGERISQRAAPAGEPLAYGSVALFRSVLQRSGARYAALAAWELAADQS